MSPTKETKGIAFRALIQLQKMDLPSSLGQLENWTKYINQLFSDNRQWPRKTMIPEGREIK